AKFCLECGRDLRGRSEFASPAAYTPKHLAERILTSRAALEGERKQVTVLFCDIANSTPLAERVGPERMHALLNGFFELALSEVHKLEGTINQFLGDGFMALFGAPLAHEDDARRAVLAAVKIRRALKDRSSYAGLGPGGELMLRMGLNTGLVVVGAFGRFVGRDGELRRLGELLHRAQAGEGGLVHVVGEAGAGKSRLLYEFRRSLGATEVTTLEVRCRSYGAAIPYLPIIDLVRSQCGIQERDTPEVVAERVRTTLQSLELPADRAPFLLHLLGIKDGSRAVEDVAQEGVRV